MSTKSGAFLKILLSILHVAVVSSADTKVPVVAKHNKQVRLNLGDHLRLECPVFSTSTGGLSHSVESANSLPHDDGASIMYHWRVRDRLDYTLDTDPRYRFSQNRRVLEITLPLELIDSGTYTCAGVTGFGKREVTFDVHVRDPNADLLCVTESSTTPSIKVPCFLNPALKQNPVITVEKPVGSSVKLNCEADGSEPLRYRWLMGNTVADWIATSQGTRGPVLTIDQLKREHTGHYTCQVSNPGGSLNYTYRLVVTELQTDVPKIVSPMENYTFTTDSSATITAQIECACVEPVIQWLKRVEPNEEMLYKRAGVTKIPLPNARETERNEMFVVLGSWADSPAIVDQAIQQPHDVEQNTIFPPESSRTYGGKDSSPRHLQKSSSTFAIDHIFVTRIHLQRPLDRERHAGKYVVMTMNLADIKTMEYVVMHVDIVQDPNFLKGRRILVYFLVPFCLLFIVIGMVAYLFVCRRRRSTNHSLTRSNEHCILRTKDSAQQAYQVMSNGRKSSPLQTSSRQSSNSQVNGKHAIWGAQSSLLSTESWSNSAPNGFEHHPRPVEVTGRQNYLHSAASQIQTNIVQNGGSQFGLNTHRNTPVTNSNVTYFPTSQAVQRTLPYPPSTSVQMHTNTGNSHTGVNYSTTYPAVVGSPNPIPNQTENSQTLYPFGSHTPNPFLSVSNCQSNGTEVSFDQYSAVSRSPMSSSTLTNHYTAPFNEYTRGQAQDPTKAFVCPQQSVYPRT